MSFGHRPPAALRFAAYSAAILDLAIGAALLVIGAQQPDGLPFVVAGAVVAASFWVAPWMLLAVRYEIADGDLLVRRGPVVRRIRLDAIDELRPSSAAPGTAGIEVHYRRGDVRAVEVVQPDDPVAFLRHVQMNARQLQATGEGTLRRAAGS